MFRPALTASLVLAAMLIAAAASAEPVTIARDSTLHAKPDASAAVTAKVKRGTSGDAGAKQGAWVNVKTSGGAGWILSFNLDYGAPSGSGGADVSALKSRLTGQQKLNVTSTIGVRGIEKEDLQKAEFNAQQVAQLEKYRASDAAAKSGAASAGLRATEIDYLDKR